nr:immunoglobulin light chain junction region [Macaca mulatta]
DYYCYSTVTTDHHGLF